MRRSSCDYAVLLGPRGDAEVAGHTSDRQPRRKHRACRAAGTRCPLSVAPLHNPLFQTVFFSIVSTLSFQLFANNIMCYNIYFDPCNRGPQ
jgi:hypothetical protein